MAKVIWIVFENRRIWFSNPLLWAHIIHVYHDFSQAFADFILLLSSGYFLNRCNCIGVFNGVALCKFSLTLFRFIIRPLRGINSPAEDCLCILLQYLLLIVVDSQTFCLFLCLLFFLAFFRTTNYIYIWFFYGNLRGIRWQDNFATSWLWW